MGCVGTIVIDEDESELRNVLCRPKDGEPRRCHCGAAGISALATYLDSVDAKILSSTQPSKYP
jgi:hypothetical protein